MESVTDSPACRELLWQTGFLLYKELYNIAEYLYSYLGSIRCSYIIIFFIFHMARFALFFEVDYIE